MIIYRLILALGFLAWLLAPAGANRDAQPAGRSFFASPTGRAAAIGTRDDPLDLRAALSERSPLRPGDTLWLLGGTYRGNFESRLAGAPAAPVIVRQFPGERATLDANTADRRSPGLRVLGADVWYWGFEVTDSSAGRRSPLGLDMPPLRATSIDVHGPRTRFINLIVHDGLQGFGLWADAPDAEVYGNLISNVGVEAGNGGHGHSIYVQNRAPGTMRMIDNILFNGFSFGIHAYTEAGFIDNLHIEGNTSFNHGVLSPGSGPKANILIGGGDIADDPFVLDNYAYYPLGKGGRGADIDYGLGCRRPEVHRNYLVADLPLSVVRCAGARVSANTLVGEAGLLSVLHPDNSYHAGRPNGVRVFVRPNRYEPGRAHVTIFNWDLHDAVAVDLSAAGLKAGEAFEVRDAQNFFAPAVARGVYLGRPVSIPMKGLTTMRPIGDVPVVPGHTAPEFGVFVVMPLVS